MTDLVKCAYRACKAEFSPKEGQRFCSPRCRYAYAYDLRRPGEKPRRRRVNGVLGLGYGKACKNAEKDQAKQHAAKRGLGAPFNILGRPLPWRGAGLDRKTWWAIVEREIGARPREVAREHNGPPVNRRAVGTSKVGNQIGDTTMADNVENGNSVIDLYDPTNLRVDQTFSEGFAVKKTQTIIHVGKPSKQDWFRVNPSAAYMLPSVAIIELKDDREMYLVLPEVIPHIVGEYTLVHLFTCINRHGVIRLWPIPLPGADGKQNSWHVSAFMAADKAKTKWVRIVPEMSAKAYTVFEAIAAISDPDWPEWTFQEILRIAFPEQTRIIKAPDHPIIQKLRGLA
jgi:hypothetical protein